MSKKDSMLQCIMDNTEWLLTTSASVEVIPYYELSYDTFSRAKQYFAKSAEYEDVVCLISTSVMQLGKSGILFTTDYVYNKAWGGILTGSYRNSIYAPYDAEFDVINEFDTERMRTLMSALADIAQEDEKKRFDDTLTTIGNTIGKVAIGGMALADIISNIQDWMIDQKKDKIVEQLGQLENSASEVSVAIEVYQNFESYIQEFMELFARNDGSDKTREIINVLNNILLLLHSQVKENIDFSSENEENYFKYITWIEFWALLFGDEEQFNQKYNNEIFEFASEAWHNVLWALDILLTDWNPGFLNIINNFSKTILANMTKVSELMQSEDFDEEAFGEIAQSNNENIEILYNALSKAMEDISLILSEI